MNTTVNEILEELYAKLDDLDNERIEVVNNLDKLSKLVGIDAIPEKVFDPANNPDDAETEEDILSELNQYINNWWWHMSTQRRYELIDLIRKPWSSDTLAQLEEFHKRREKITLYDILPNDKVWVMMNNKPIALIANTCSLTLKVQNCGLESVYCHVKFDYGAGNTHNIDSRSDTGWEWSKEELLAKL